jgi:hypothetical protein
MNIETKINFIIYGFVLMALYLVLREYKIIEGFTENIDSAALSAIASIYNDKVLRIDKLIVTDSIDVRNGTVKIDDNIVTTGSCTFGGSLDMNGSIKTKSNIEADGYGQFGLAKIGSNGLISAEFSHKKHFNSSDQYGMLHRVDGIGLFNSFTKQVN